MRQNVGHLELVADSPHEVAAWVAARTGRGQPFMGQYQALGFARRGRLVAGFVFDRMQPNRGSIEMSAAGVGAFMTPDVVRFLCWNVFQSLGVAHCSARTSATNLRAQRALEKAGFVPEGTQRNAWDGETDAVLFGLTRNDAERWLSADTEVQANGEQRL